MTQNLEEQTRCDVTKWWKWLRFLAGGRLFRGRLLWQLAWILAIGGMGACAQVPTKEFRTYRDTFNAANDAAREVILDYGAAKAEFARRGAEIKNARASVAGSASLAANGQKGGAKSSPAYPASFTSTLQNKQPASDAVEVRLRALDTIHRYNEILADLAEGKSAADLAISAKSLVASIESLTQPIPGLSGFASGLLAAAEKARARAEFVTAVKAGEPSVSSIVDFLGGETGKYYELRWLLSERDRSLVRARISNRVAESETVVRSKKIPDSAKEDLQAIREEFDIELTTIGGLSDRPEGVKFEMGKNGADFDAADLAALQKNLGEVRNDVNLHQTIVSKMNTYHTLLQNYDRLLLETRQSMRSLRLALDAPVDVATQMEEVYRTAMSVRADLTKLRTNF